MEDLFLFAVGGVSEAERAETEALHTQNKSDG
jgi:hypothetical protein